MNVSNLKFNTCGLADTMLSYYDTMKENGMSKYELDKVMEALNLIVELNQKYVKWNESEELK